MGELDFANAFGPGFWVIMAVLTLALIAIGYWLGGVIARKTDTGFGAFMIVLLVTIMVASAIIPMAMFAAMGNILAVANPLAPVDDAMIDAMAFDSFGRIILATLVSTGSTIAFFIASIIGVARGRI